MNPATALVVVKGGDMEGSFCDGCPGPQSNGLDCESCDESDLAKKERMDAFQDRGGRP